MIGSGLPAGFGDNEDFKSVLEMGTGTAPLISRQAVLEEAKRRGILGPNCDPEADLELLDDSPGAARPPEPPIPPDPPIPPELPATGE